MPTSYPCPQCGQVMQVAENQLGQTSPCPSCGRTITVTQPNNDSQGAAASAPAQTARGKPASKFFKILLAAGLGFFIIIIAINGRRVRLSPEAGRETSSKSKMSQIGRAIFLFGEQTGRIANDIYEPRDPKTDTSEPRKPLLSWRVRILPYMEERDLYEQFHFDEPWDSQHNRTLIEHMPPLFRSPHSNLPPTEYRTNYLAVQGEATVISPTDRGFPIEEMTDRPENTIWLVEVNDASAVVWTRPADVEVEAEMTGVFEQLRGIGRPTFLVSFFDGAVYSLDESITPEQFYQLCTCNGGELIFRNAFTR